MEKYNLIIGIVLIISILMVLSILIFAFLRGNKTKLLISFLTFQFMYLLLCVIELLNIFGSRIEYPAYKILNYFLICFTPLAFYVFGLQFINNKLKVKNLFIYSIPNQIIFLLKIAQKYKIGFFTGNLHIAAQEVVLKIYAIIPYLYMLITAIILMRYIIKNMFSSFKISSILTICINIIICLSIFISIFYEFFHEKYNLIHIENIAIFICVSLSSVIFSILTFKYRFLNISVALRSLLENINEAVCFIDIFGHINYYNDKFLLFFPFVVTKNAKFNAEEFCMSLKNMVKETPFNLKIIKAIKTPQFSQIAGEIEFNKKELKYFYVLVKPIYANTKEPLGRVVTFRDVTKDKMLLYELNEKNDEILAMNEELIAANEELSAMNEKLTTLNSQLMDYSKVAEELAIEKERTRIARDSHDTIGHTMTKIISLLEVCCILHNKEDVKIVDKLNEATKCAREGMSDIRRSIKGMVPEKLELNNLETALKGLVDEFCSAGITVNLTLDKINQTIKKEIANVIFRVCQEALTNSVKHGQSKNVSILIKSKNNYLELFIFDDGIGCANVNKGFGLIGMEQRIKSVAGIINYGSSGDCGFNIFSRIPL